MKAVFSKRSTVTASAVASGAEENGHHVEPETDRDCGRNFRGRRFRSERERKDQTDHGSTPLAGSTRRTPDPDCCLTVWPFSITLISQATSLYKPSNASALASIGNDTSLSCAVISGGGPDIVTPFGNRKSPTDAFPGKGRFTCSLATISPCWPRSTDDLFNSTDKYDSATCSLTNGDDARRRP